MKPEIQENYMASLMLYMKQFVKQSNMLLLDMKRREYEQYLTRREVIELQQASGIETIITNINTCIVTLRSARSEGEYPQEVGSIIDETIAQAEGYISNYKEEFERLYMNRS